jgi:hypothetical protein
MSDVRWIANKSELPAGKKFVLVEYGLENGLSRHSSGLTYSVNRGLNANLLEAHLQTVISEAQTLADFEKIDTVYVTVPRKVAHQSDGDAS